MTQKNKTKAYDEALQRAKEQRYDYQKELNKADKNSQLAGILRAGIRAIELVFPELTESEDERIKKELIAYLNGELAPGRELIERWLTWLEKQKELPFVKDVVLGYPGLYFYDGERMHFRGSPAMEEKQKEWNFIFDKEYLEDNPSMDEFEACMLRYLQSAANREDDSEIIADTKDYKRRLLYIIQKEQNSKDRERTDFTIYHPLKNGKGKYECIPYSFYGSLTSFSEDKDLIDFLRTCFYTKEECNKWIEQQEEQKPLSSEETELNSVAFLTEIGYTCIPPSKDGVIEKKIDALMKDQKPVDKNKVGDLHPEECPATYDECIKSVKWSEEDKLHLNNAILAAEKEWGNDSCTSRWLKSLPERFNLELKAGWSDEDEGELQNAIDALEFLGKKGVYKSESGYNAALQAASWLKSLSLNPKKKSEDVAKLCSNEWSEEDEHKLNHILEIVHIASGREASVDEKEELESFLKSLRPQSHCKISEELDIDTLRDWSMRFAPDIRAAIEATAYHFYNLSSQPKQEWSEEDEKTIDDAYCWLCDYAGSLRQKSYEKSSMLYGIADKLKSLPPQSKEELTKMLQDEYNKGKAAGKREGYTKGYNKGYKDANESVSYHYPIMPTTPVFGCDGIHCTNPQMDCINCPRKLTGGMFNTASSSGDLTLKVEWKPSEDEERLINTSISFLKDFANKGYENAVECIDWLKSKLNGNTCK